MKFPNYFIDATSSFGQSKYVIFGIPYDKTGSFRKGTCKAPYSIRQSSWNFESYDLLTGIDLKDVNIHDYGDLDIRKDENFSDMKNTVISFVNRVIKNNKIPIAIGGEHTVSFPIVDAIRNIEDDICIVVFDAHLDFKDIYNDDHHSHACVSRRISEVVGVDNMAILGVRSGTREEFEYGKKKGLFYINSYDINTNGIELAVKKTLDKFKNKKLYLTLDIDVIDPSFAPGTSTPEPFGISPFDVLKSIESFSSQIIGFDLVEVCPPYDHGETSLLAAKIIKYVIENIYSKKDG